MAPRRRCDIVFGLHLNLHDDNRYRNPSYFYRLVVHIVKLIDILVRELKEWPGISRGQPYPSTKQTSNGLLYGTGETLTLAEDQPTAFVRFSQYLDAKIKYDHEKALAEPVPPGLKHDSGKGQWSLLTKGCPNALAGVVAVLTFGAKKYAAHNWKSVEDGKTRYLDALHRHLNAIARGEKVDADSGLPHWHHVTCNALFLAELNK